MSDKRVGTWVVVWLVVCCPVAAGAAAADDSAIVLGNRHVVRELRLADGVWRTVRFARPDGSDELKVRSDEFHVLPLEAKAGFTIEHYKAVGPPVRTQGKGVTTVRITYRPRKALPRTAPAEVVVTYTLGEGPYLRKSLKLTMAPGQAVDRLQVERFSTPAKASRGGRGEPVFVGKAWFFGVEYPAAQSRHSSGFAPRPYAKVGNYSWIGLDGRDEEFAPRDGLVTMFHFPGPARQEARGGPWLIASKTAVAGLGAKGDTLELAFMDYLDTIRRPVRSFIHYNNWYDATGKDLSVANFVDRTHKAFKANLDPYGVTIHAMVPDNGWQNRASIWQPSERHFPEGMKSFAALGKALRAQGTRLGLWFALNGYNTHIDWGRANGYAEAVRNERFKRFKRYYCLASPKYNAALRKQLSALIRAGDLSYIKHDFNEMCCTGAGHGHLATDRHGHEAAVDAEIDLLAMERSVQPEIYQNITNWIWFSPWWLMHGNNLWMLSGDSGVNRNWPQISTRQMAITYRDAHLHRMWGDPATRPLVPISHLMTHGIIFADRQRAEAPGDTLRDWADYVVMYYGRGLQLKEWYITPKMMTPDRWKVLGRATRWSEENVATLANSVMIGGNASQGKAYGYVCWNGAKAILTLRNPDIMPQTLRVPFDATVWYRGAMGRAFRGRVIYPYVGTWRGGMVSGKPIDLVLPGEATLVMELDAGTATAVADHPPAATGIVADRSTDAGRLACKLALPDEKMGRCDLVLIVRGSVPGVTVNGKAVGPDRKNTGKGWAMQTFDLRAFAGKTVAVRIASMVAGSGAPGSIFLTGGGSTNVEAYLVMDRVAGSAPAPAGADLPWAVGDGYRRQTLRLFKPTALSGAAAPAGGARRKLTAADLAGAKAAKLRIRIFGSNGGRYAAKQIMLNGKPLMRVPVSRGDRWQQVVLDLPAAAVKRLKLSNTLRLTNVGGDSYKFALLTLAVRLGDGKWVAGTVDPRVHTSVADWKHAEGETFEKPSVSKEITLKFD